MIEVTTQKRTIAARSEQLQLAHRFLCEFFDEGWGNE
jgi:hypothetical protein